LISNHLLCLGFGYTAQALARALLAEGWRISATFRDPRKAPTAIEATAFPPPADASVTHILCSIPPDANGDPALPLLPAYKNLRWAGYLSATSVYGDHAGAWVDEEAICAPTSARGHNRLKAEQQWQAGTPAAHIFRLAGIYGPGRNALQDIRAHTAKRIDAPGVLFSRIHVADIVATLQASMRQPAPGRIYNVADDEPAASHEVVSYACTLLGVAPPPLVPLARAHLSPMAAEFYRDSKRIGNERIKSELGVSLRYPTYRDGLNACHADGD